MTDRELVDALCAIESGLTEWEVEFVEALARLRDLPRASGSEAVPFLSDGRRRKANQILEEKGDE